MRCVACGLEMRLVRALPDQSMMVSGKELRTFQCPRCDREEQQLVFTRVIDRFRTERMQFPARSSELRGARGGRLPNVAEAWGRAWSKLRRSQGAR
jgi:hypothetical protein